MTWLRRWNPLIDWGQQVMYIRTQHGWDRIRGLMLDRQHRVGTVNILTNEDLASLESAPDITNLRTPQFWTYAAGASLWTNVPTGGVRQENTQNFDSSCAAGANSSNYLEPAPKRTVQYTRVAGYCTTQNQQQGSRTAPAVVVQANAEADEEGRSMLFGTYPAKKSSCRLAAGFPRS